MARFLLMLVQGILKGRSLGTFLHWLATGSYIGYLPAAPGTWATLLLGVPLCVALKQLGEPLYVFGCLAVAAVSVVSSGFVEGRLQEKDPPFVVIDEVAGFLASMILVPLSLVPLVVACAFFRLFDIVKPPPIKKLEQRCPGGWGITLDDLVAGLYANLALQSFLYFVTLCRHS